MVNPELEQSDDSIVYAGGPAVQSNDPADSVVYEVAKSDDDIRRFIAELKRYPVVAVDTENTAIDPYVGKPLLVQMATSEKSYIFPMYLGFDTTPLKELLEDRSITKVLFNALYDYKWLYVHCKAKTRNIFCCQIAERILTVGKPGASKWIALAGVVRRYLGLELKKEIRSRFVDRDPIAEPLLESEYRYAAADTVLLFGVYYAQLAELEENSLTNVCDLERNVLPVFAEMELHGSLIDSEKWAKLVELAAQKRQETSKEIFKCFAKVVPQRNLFGLPLFNLDSRPQLMEYMSKLGFDLMDTEEATLKRYKDKHPVFQLMLKYRGFSKVVTSYGTTFLEKIHPITKRVHANFNQLEADTGRASSSKPNLQQVPGFNEKDPDSLDFRSCFIARPGYKLICADFSQQELRILADLSDDPVFRKAYTTLGADGKELDVHKYTASVIFQVPYDSVSSSDRTKAKTLNFFLVFGGGASALADELKIEEDEAQKIIDDYFRRYPKIKRYLDKAGNDAVNLGFAMTISGRKRYLPLPPQDDPTFKKILSSAKRKGKNTPMQGGGADVTKQAMIYVHGEIERNGYDARILKVVHDELIVEVREDQAEVVAKMVEREMIHGFTHFFKRIPMRVDAKISDTWAK